MTDLSKPTITETLLKEHTHDGVLKPAGAKIEVTAPERAWLIEQGVIADSAAKTKTPKE